MNNFLTFKICSTFSRSFIRKYAFKSELKIKWVRPEKISCILPEKSGDLKPMPTPDKKRILKDYADAESLKDASEEVKTLFTLGENRRYHSVQAYREDMIREVQRHKQDFGSMEAKLAKMTADIRAMQEEMKVHPRNMRRKVYLKEMIEKRKKFLKYLRRWDYRRFEWILEKLDLVYKPPPAEFHWITRKESLKKLVIQHCENLKQERLDAYRKTLEDQQIGFLEKKLKNLEFIRKEQQECQVPVTISEEEIKTVRKQLEDCKAERSQSEAEPKS